MDGHRIATVRIEPVHVTSSPAASVQKAGD